MTPGQSIAATVTLLAASNLFMTFAWSGICLAQLKIMQEVITLAIFVPFAMLTWGRASSGITCGRRCA